MTGLFGITLWPPFSPTSTTIIVLPDDPGNNVSALFGITLWPPFSLTSTTPVVLPYDLAEAIKLRFDDLSATTLTGLTKIYQTSAGDRVQEPYLVFEIHADQPIEFISDASQWHDTRVRFEVFADSQEDANQLRNAVASEGCFAGKSLDFESGIMTRFVMVRRAEAKERGRIVNAKYVFKATVTFQTRVRHSG